MTKTIGQMSDEEFTAYQREQTRKLNERLDGPVKDQKQPDQNSREMEQAKKAGYVQGVCECAALVGNQTMAKKLLTEMKVNKDLAKKYAGPETYKALEQGVFAPKPEHRRELTRSRGRSL